MGADRKQIAAEAALECVTQGMRLGIGTGTTAEAFIHALAARVAGGLDVTGVATSIRTEELCDSLGITMTTLDAMPELDLTIDGADEIDPRLGLIKGGGGALLREKIVAAASRRMVVIADESKLVERLGAFGVPIEVNRFGLAATRIAIEALAKSLGLAPVTSLRHSSGEPFVTDGGHLVVDASFGLIHDPKALSDGLLQIAGVVQHGLFLDLASAAYVAGPGGVRVISS